MSGDVWINTSGWTLAVGDHISREEGTQLYSGAARASPGSSMPYAFIQSNPASGGSFGYGFDGSVEEDLFLWRGQGRRSAARARNRALLEAVHQGTPSGSLCPTESCPALEPHPATVASEHRALAPGGRRTVEFRDGEHWKLGAARCRSHGLWSSELPGPLRPNPSRAVHG
jgi:hypothetical protein